MFGQSFDEAMVLYDAGDFKAARVALEPVAAAGDIQAQLQLGLIYANGTGTVRQIYKAAGYFKAAADQGDLAGRTYYAAMLLSGEGAVQDESVGYDMMLAAAEEGWPEAQFSIAEMYWNARVLKLNKTQIIGLRATAVEWLKKAAASGHSDAMVMLGHAYASGLKNVPQNVPEALRLYQEAAAMGNAKAAYALALVHEAGQSVPRDANKAMAYYRQAAEGGYPEAQIHLGRIYEKGIGVPADFVQSTSWYKKAAEQGDPDAMILLGNAYEFGRGIEQNYRQAKGWYLRASRAGRPDGEAHFALLYYYGKGVKQDVRQANTHLMLAAGQGSALAGSMLERIREEKAKSDAARKASMEQFLQMLFDAGVALANSSPTPAPWQTESDFDREQRHIKEQMERTWGTVGGMLLLQ
ncbi:Putative beta-lactamase HcpC precursor [Maliponia aquimaris]|uniref:Putative beta-lactamase HcpC n=2 Tax=Maliponia aquimaris TaxID=1673631 RepID=A0A238L4A0_9RHOB|nr:Putative beta-lactamase HcpC precursor [Maliponia aquimaris]